MPDPAASPETTREARDSRLAERKAELHAAAPPVIPPCPSWCVSTAALHPLDFDVNELVYVRTHEAFTGEIATVLVTELSDGHGGPVSLSEPVLTVYGGDYQGDQVAPQRVLDLAAELRQAALVLVRLGESEVTDRRRVQPHTIYPVGESTAEIPQLDQRRGGPYDQAPEGLCDVYGWCAPFCIADGPSDGQTVAAHGPWCTSPQAVSVDGHTPEGREVALTASLAQLYMHGVYRKGDLDRGAARHRLVQLTLDEGLDDGTVLLLTGGEVRTLAAGLVRAADAADDAGRDLNGAVAERRGRQS